MKKFILFVVEGINDKKELDSVLHSSCFDKYRDKYEPFIYTTDGDITTSKDNSAKNIQKKLNEILMDFRKKGIPFSNISVSDIQEMVQIVDLDGTFIPLENIVQGKDNIFEYADDMIITSNIDGAVGRNRKKAEIIKKLVEIENVGNVRYSVYYVSCNMDHVLFNERNSSTLDKKENSLKFSLDCSENDALLHETIFNSEIMYSGSYYDSWDFVQSNTNSLGRFTNLNLFFDERAKHKK